MSTQSEAIIEEYLNQNDIKHVALEKLVNEVLEMQTLQENQKLQAMLREKERIEQEIKTQTLALQETRQNSFAMIEKALFEKFTEVNPDIQKKLTQLKLESIDILDVLAEITESAFISALESGENLEATFQEIARDLTHKTLRDGYLTLERAKHVIGTIISKASEIAEASPNQAREIFRGTLYGTKKGLTQSIQLFKERFAYIPDELQPLQIKNMEQTIRDLRHTDSLFIQVINEEAKLASPIMQKELLFIVERMRPDLTELINVSVEALNVVSDTLSNVSKEALQRSQIVLKSKAAIEAKRMGVNVWAVAKSAINGAINSAKDAIDQNKPPKR